MTADAHAEDDNAAAPVPFPEWRTEPDRRAEDAAHTFGFHLIAHCRNEALATQPPDVPDVHRAVVAAAVDTALHNVVDLLEGFWKLRSGPSHTVEYALTVRVRDEDGSLVESQEIAPSRLDLPMAYWLWARDGQFR